MARSLLLVASAIVLAGCGAPDESPGSLLARAPDQLIEEVGEVVPSEGAGWGDGGEGEWFGALAPALDGEPMCWSKGRRAYLVLRSLGGSAHTLRLRVAGAPGGAERLRVTLGARDLGEVEIDRSARWIEFATDAFDWSEGQNLLSLEVDATGQLEDARFAGIGVARVSWAEPRRVERSAQKLVLADGTGATFHLSASPGARVVLAGRTSGDGSLVASAGAFRPRDSSVRYDREPLSVLPKGGRLAWEVALSELSADFERSTASLRLAWRGDAPLEITELRVVDAARTEPPPSIVFVSVDTLAAKHLSSYGYPRRTTPNIDRLARSSVVFEACIANAPWTVPSYLSQFTGLYPLAHEVDPLPGSDAQAWETNYLAASRWTLAEALRARGYATAAWIDNPWVSAGMGMDQGFDLFDTSAAEIYLSNTSGGFAHMLEPSMRWMAAQQRPFFALLQPMDPHGPYFTRWRYRGRWDGDGLYDAQHELPVGFGQLHVYGVIPEYVAWEERRGFGPPLERMRTEPFANAYDEKIAEVDDYFGRLYGFLDRSGILEHSIVVFSSDHGEAVGEHQFWFDHGTLYDEVLRVPLIVHLPGGRNGGTRVATPVQLVDLMPTLLELAGAPLPDHLHGRSLVPALEGEAIAERPLYARGGIGQQESLEFGGNKLVWSIPTSTSYQTILRHPHMPAGHVERIAPELAGTFWPIGKYAQWFEGRWALKQELFAPIMGEFRELYQRDQDPLELSDRLAGVSDALSDPRAADLERLRLEEQARGEAARADASRALRPAVLSDEVRKQLEALGYLEPTGSGHR